MSSPNIFYVTYMNSQTGYRATWAPDVPLKIGMIGKIDKFGVFNVFSSLVKQGIPAEILSDTSSAEMDYTSHESVSITTKAAGSVPVAGSVLTSADAGFVFEFKSDQGVVFQTGGHKTHQLTNLEEIEQQILLKYDDGAWEKDLLIITQLAEADTATIIISNSSNVQLELKAKADVGTQELKLTDVSLGLTVARERGSTLKYITRNGLTPLYRVMGIRHPLFGKPYLGTRSDKEEQQKETFKIQEFDPGELTQ
jgi:hypothetical protein